MNTLWWKSRGKQVLNDEVLKLDMFVQNTLLLKWTCMFCCFVLLKWTCMFCCFILLAFAICINILIHSKTAVTTFLKIFQKQNIVSFHKQSLCWFVF